MNTMHFTRLPHPVRRSWGSAWVRTRVRRWMGFGLALAWLGTPASALAQPDIDAMEAMSHANDPVPEAADAYTRSQAVNPGQDQQSKLTLRIKDTDGNSRKVILRRFWKRYPNSAQVASKVLLFHEYPPENRGTAFMAWSYPELRNLPPDQWLYIPVLRKVAKLPSQAEENIQGSDLRGSDMDPRPAKLDRHVMQRAEVIGSQRYFVVESTPIAPDKDYPYSRVVRWISDGEFLVDKIDYYDRADNLLKKQTISWKQIGDAWVWRKVVITNVQTGSQTTLNLSDIRVNQGLKESLFTERMMQQGAAALQ